MKYYVARLRIYNKANGEMVYASADEQLGDEFEKARDLFIKHVTEFLKNSYGGRECHYYFVEVTHLDDHRIENEIIDHVIRRG